jgi:hypothetical protein
MAGNDGNQKSKQNHAEGQHGPKTHDALIDSLEHPVKNANGASDASPHNAGSAFGENPSDGGHRLHEDRQQHDEAEKNSEAQKAAELDIPEQSAATNGRRS